MKGDEREMEEKEGKRRRLGKLEEMKERWEKRIKEEMKWKTRGDERR